MTGRNRFLSSDSVTLEEAITAYEKLKKGRDFPTSLRIVSESECQENNAGETTPMFQSGSDQDFSHHPDNGKFSTGLLNNLNTYRDFSHSKYSYYSAEADLVQASAVELLSFNYEKLLKAPHFWLNIRDPDEDDIQFLRETFDVNEIVLSEIQEKNAQERVETFRQHTFISLRLLAEQHGFGSTVVGATRDSGKSTSTFTSCFSSWLCFQWLMRFGG